MARTRGIVDKHVGARIQAVRKFRCMTVEEVACGLCVTHGEYADFEQGYQRIDPASLIKLARLLKVNVASFFNAESFVRALKIKSARPRATPKTDETDPLDVGPSREAPMHRPPPTFRVVQGGRSCVSEMADADVSEGKRPLTLN